jgi:V-type H+-transporting ATPase subunit a
MTAREVLRERAVMIDPASTGNLSTSGYYGSPYPFGIDPVWQVATNKIVFLNSFKMKIAIIIGVIHMLFGVLMSLWNNKYFNNKVNIMCDFVPQFIFLSFMFGYMCLLMFHKWTSYVAGGFDGEERHLTTERCAPSVLITFINMVLFKVRTMCRSCLYNRCNEMVAAFYIQAGDIYLMITYRMYFL